MSISSRSARVVAGSWWRIAATGLIVALAQVASGEEWDENFAAASLAEVGRADADDAPGAVQNSDESKQGFLDAPAACDCCCQCTCQPGFVQELEAAMKCMAAQGIVYGAAVPQFYQGVTQGGREQEFEYGGKVDQFLILDSTKLGMWEGMTMTMHVETRYGQDVNFDAVGLAPVNVAMLYPNFNEHDTAITGLSFAQLHFPRKRFHCYPAAPK